MPENRYELNNKDPQERKKSIRNMFDSIVPTYDFLNRFLSMGVDSGWRRFLIKLMKPEGRKVLDLCCGTGDLSKKITGAGADTVSLDFSLPMLEKGRKKGWLGSKCIAGDATSLPVKDSVFDFVTISFGIRNIPDIDNFLSETARVLNSEGKLYILELTRPQNRFVLFFYNFYLKKFLPVVGGIVSGKLSAYRYLAGTISTFIEPHELVGMIEKHQFNDIRRYPLTFGVATLYECSVCKSA